MENEKISERFSYPDKYVEVDGVPMHFVEEGEGDPILFLHGIPTSCYVWRNIIPNLAPLGRCIAPDLIGFGRSAKPDIRYSVFDHIHYINQFIECLDLHNLTMIMHGFGSVIGFHYAMEHEKNCKGLVFYEAFLRSLNGLDISLPFHEQLIALQNQENVYDLVLSGTAFVDKVIPQYVMRKLTDEEMNHYREPFLQEGAGRPILQYLKELPMGDGKSKVEQLIADYTQKLSLSPLPKLMLYSVPGFITTIATVVWAKEHLPNLEIVDLGEELHLAQETSPQLMGKVISAWLQGVEQTRVK